MGVPAQETLTAELVLHGVTELTAHDFIAGVDVFGPAFDGSGPPAFSARIAGGFDDDVTRGTEGNDFITDFGGTNVLKAGRGDDQVLGGIGTDRIHGEAGDDILFGGAGADQLHGYAGDDRIDGGDGDDVLSGGGGDDFIETGIGQNIVLGGAGNDRLIGTNGGDEMSGGGGNDQFITNIFTPSAVLDFGGGDDVLVLRGPPSFDSLDSDGDGVLGDLDTLLEVRDVSFGGSPVESLVFLNYVADQDQYVPTIALGGVTQLSREEVFSS